MYEREKEKEKREKNAMQKIYGGGMRWGVGELLGRAVPNRVVLVRRSRTHE